MGKRKFVYRIKKNHSMPLSSWYFYKMAIKQAPFDFQTLLLRKDNNSSMSLSSRKGSYNLDERDDEEEPVTTLSFNASLDESVC